MQLTGRNTEALGHNTMSDKQDKKSNDTDRGGNGKDRIIRVERNEAGQLVVYIRGRDEPVVDAQIARSFPWSVPDSYISVRDKDGAEIAMLETLGQLDDKSRDVVQTELTEKIFNPKIKRILDYNSEFGVTSVKVETDRGEVMFQIRSRDDVRVLSPTRALFRDVDGNTYELADLNALDPASRKHVEKYF